VRDYLIPNVSQENLINMHIIKLPVILQRRNNMKGNIFQIARGAETMPPPLNTPLLQPLAFS